MIIVTTDVPPADHPDAEWTGAPDPTWSCADCGAAGWFGRNEPDGTDEGPDTILCPTCLAKRP